MKVAWDFRFFGDISDLPDERYNMWIAAACTFVDGLEVKFLVYNGVHRGEYRMIFLHKTHTKTVEFSHLNEIDWDSKHH